MAWSAPTVGATQFAMAGSSNGRELELIQALIVMLPVMRSGTGLERFTEFLDPVQSNCIAVFANSPSRPIHSSECRSNHFPMNRLPSCRSLRPRNTGQPARMYPEQKFGINQQVKEHRLLPKAELRICRDEIAEKGVASSILLMNMNVIADRARHSSASPVRTKTEAPFNPWVSRREKTAVI